MGVTEEGRGLRRHLPGARQRRCCCGAERGAELSPLPAGEARSEHCTGSQRARLKPWLRPARKPRAPPLLSDQPVPPPCLSPRTPAPPHLPFSSLPPGWGRPGAPPGGHPDWQWQYSSREGASGAGGRRAPGRFLGGPSTERSQRRRAASGSSFAPRAGDHEGASAPWGSHAPQGVAQCLPAAPLTLL